MSNKKYFQICLIFIPTIIFFSTSIKAQTAVNYKFFEVFDFTGQPVENAAVKTEGYNAREQKTNQKGQVEGGIEVWVGDYNTTGFTVTKPGYYPFADIFELIRSSQPIRLELLIIPKTTEEVKAIGNEEFKRELFTAAKSGDSEAVRKFLKMGLNPNLTTFDLRGIPKVNEVPVILFAAKSGDAETIKELLAAGATVGKKDSPVRSILNQYLYASPDASRKAKTEAERRQILNDYESGAESLIKAGANIEYTGQNEIPALLIAAGKGYRGIIELLIKSGVPISIKDVGGRTALIYAIEAPWIFEKADIDTLNYLLKLGADPNIIVSSYYDYCDTALLAAVRKRNVEAVKMLIQYQADVNLGCKNGDTALSLAKRDFAANPSYPYNVNLPEIIELLEAAGTK